jgi:hypothetical protein
MLSCTVSLALSPRLSVAVNWKTTVSFCETAGVVNVG